MRLLCLLLPVIVQGVSGQMFSVEPQALSVVRRGEAVTLECITREDVICGWKLAAPELSGTGFMNTAIPQSLDITARDPTSKRDCTITLNNVDSRYNGKYTCSPYANSGAQEDSSAAEVIIAQKPSQVRFVGDAAGGFDLPASAEEPTSVTCEAGGARPKATLEWYLDNTQVYKDIQVEDETDPDSQAVTSRSTLTYQFHKEDHGKRLRCVANHVGYDEDDNREVAVSLNVEYPPYRPEGNNIGKIYGFTAGQEGQITVNFTANPQPTVMSWKVGDRTRVPVNGESLDKRFRAGPLETRDAATGKYSLSLTINPVLLEDQSKKFQLLLENSAGQAALEFTIGTGAAPPPPAVGGAEIAGIVVAVLVLLLIIGLVAFGRSRGKWCFAGKGARQVAAAPPRPAKVRRPSTGGASVDGGRPRARPRSGLFGMPMSYQQLKESLRARPNRERLDVTDGGEGQQEVTYSNQSPQPAQLATEARQTRAGETASGPAAEPASPPTSLPTNPPPSSVASFPESADTSPVDIPQLEAPPRSLAASAAARRAEPALDLSLLPQTPPEPVSPILFPTSAQPAQPWAQPWQPPAAGQRAPLPPSADRSRYTMAGLSVDLPPTGSREELGIPYPAPPPLPPKARPQSMLPAGATRIVPASLQSELQSRFPSSPMLASDLPAATV